VFFERRGNKIKIKSGGGFLNFELKIGWLMIYKFF